MRLPLKFFVLNSIHPLLFLIPLSLALASPPNDGAVRNAAVKGLAMLYPYLEEELMQMLETVRDKCRQPYSI